MVQVYLSTSRIKGARHRDPRSRAGPRRGSTGRAREDFARVRPDIMCALTHPLDDLRARFVKPPGRDTLLPSRYLCIAGIDNERNGRFAVLPRCSTIGRTDNAVEVSRVHLAALTALRALDGVTGGTFCQTVVHKSSRILQDIWKGLTLLEESSGPRAPESR